MLSKARAGTVPGSRTTDLSTGSLVSALNAWQWRQVAVLLTVGYRVDLEFAMASRCGRAPRVCANKIEAPRPGLPSGTGGPSTHV